MPKAMASFAPIPAVTTCLCITPTSRWMGYRSLKAGQFVDFDIHASGNGFHAVNLRPLHSPDEGEAPVGVTGEAPDLAPARLP